MPEKITVGPINRGLRTDREPFVIDNDSFPYLFNSYQWRGRIKRKRGTRFLTRLKRFFNSLSASYNSGATTITLDGTGAGNVLSGFGLETNASLIPGSVTITAPGPTVYTDPSMDGTLSPSGTINYSSGEIVIAAEANNAVSVTFNYYPALPVMGIEDLNLNATQFPGTLAFDTTYAYNILTADPSDNYDVSFYKNPPVDVTTMPGYVQKVVVTPTSWNGEDYQQFWSTNYQGAFWVTNGINVPFSAANIGMQFKLITAPGVVGIGGASPEIVDITVTAHGLSVGDFVFINEVEGIDGINFQTGYVTVVVDANTITVEFPNAVFTGAWASGGIVQYLTNRSNPNLDNIRWYDGDPTNSNPDNPVLNGEKGWVNFMPPLSRDNFSIADLPVGKWYLVGARMILPFRDRLLFFGPVVQRSSGNAVYLQDTVIYSQNGTPYYTASFDGDPSLITTEFHPLLVPVNQTAVPGTFWGDQAGFGGFITAGNAQPIITVSSNEDVLIIGFSDQQARLVYTGNDIVPFNFYVINSEYGSSSTFSAINMDKGVITKGSRGYLKTSQVQCERMDLEIPDQVYEVQYTQNGNERVCAQRNFIQEWMYFTYPSNQNNYESSPNEFKFPNQTLFYNYRDDSWAVFNETYTTYGIFRFQSGFTWATVGRKYPTWSAWNDPWNAGTSTLLNPLVVGGNQQGFIMVRDVGTSEGTSLYIKDIAANIVTSPSHGLQNNDYIIISDVIGTIDAEVNGKVFSVFNVTTDTFALKPVIGAGTYLGGGLIRRLYVPYFQTRQFPVSWGMSRKVRIGAQQYLLSTTDNGQIQLLIFLSQNADSPYNTGTIYPTTPNPSDPANNALVYSTVLYTCPESTNLGLTPITKNLNTPTAIQQAQIWHRINTSLIGDTVQIGFTVSDEQMRDPELTLQFSEIELHGFVLDVYPSQLLS